MQSIIPQKGNFVLGFYLTVSDCTVSAFRMRTLCLYHVMFCLQSQQYIVQQEIIKNGHMKGKKINQYHTHIDFVILYLSRQCTVLNPLI